MDYWSILVSAVLGGLGGGLGALASTYIKSHSKKGGWGVIFIPIGFLAGFAIGKVIPLAKKPIYDQGIKPVMERNRIENMVVEIADEYNKKLPMMIDQDTQLRNITTQDSTLRYNYYFIAANASDFDIPVWRSSAMPILAQRICNSDMKNAIRAGIIYEYAYHGKDGVLMSVLRFDRC